MGGLVAAAAGLLLISGRRRQQLGTSACRLPTLLACMPPARRTHHRSLSPLAIQTRNLLEDPRCSVVVQMPGWTGLVRSCGGRRVGGGAGLRLQLDAHCLRARTAACAVAGLGFVAEA